MSKREFLINGRNVKDPIQYDPSFNFLSPYFSIDSRTLVPKDLNQVYCGANPLFFCLLQNQLNLPLTTEHWDYLIKNSDLSFSVTGVEPMTTFMMAIITQSPSFIMKKEYFDLFMKASDWQFINNSGDSHLTLITNQIIYGNLEVSLEQFEHLIYKSNLLHTNNYGYSALSLILYGFDHNNDIANLNMPDSLWQYIFKNSDLNIIMRVDQDSYSLLDLISRVKREDWKNYFLNLYNEFKVEKLNPTTIDVYKDKISQTVGLKEVKEYFNTLMYVNEFNKNRNLPISSHMRIIFSGNHGTGKSLVADSAAKFYSLLNLTKNDSCHTVFNEFFDHIDLSFFLNKTVYCKFDAKIKYDSNVEIKMIESLKKLGDSTLFILSVTPEELEQVKVKYPKFYSFFTKTISFPDYSSEELADITKKLAKEYEFNVSEKGYVKLISLYESHRKNKTIPFSNVYLVKSTINKMVELHASRIKDTVEDYTFIGLDVPEINTNSSDKPIEDLFKEINDMVGLDSVKKTLLDYIALVKANQKRGTELTTNMHLVFTGNPGTGKTTVARMIGKIYKSLGLLPSGHVVETDRSQLVGQYIGHTAVQTKELIQKSMGGILFIDEAYSLTNSTSTNDFGKESVETLLKHMEDHRKDFAVIVAGYKNEMETFISSNPGLKSRFTKTVLFEDYTMEQLIEILKNTCTKEKFKYDNEFLFEAENYLNGKKQKISKKTIGFNTTENHSFKSDESFGNAREIRTLFEKVLEKQAVRIMNNSSADPWLLIGEDVRNISN